MEPVFKLVDTHCHLNFDVFDPDRQVVLERAQDNGITRVLIPGIDLETSNSALECAHKYPNVFAAVGIHPNDGSSWNDASLAEIKRLAGERKVVAIGEIGLDYYRDYTPKDTQKEIFRQQLELAAELGLPVIIHNRDAFDDILVILREWCESVKTANRNLAGNPGVLHAFSGDLSFAREMIALKFKLGIDGPVTYKSSHSLQDVVASVPLESLLVETDAPFLTPIPYRGMRNEPGNVRIVASKIAEIRDEPVELVAKMTTAGADELFRWREMQ